MSTTLTREDLHQRLLKESLGGKLSEEDCLLWMVLLHTHELRLRPGSVNGLNGTSINFPAITQRQCAQVVATLWADLKHDPGDRSNYVYWYARYNTETPYEVVSDIPDALLPRLAQLREALLGDPRVLSVVPEE